MKIKKLDWDSNFFKLNIGEVCVETAPIHILSFTENYDLIYCNQTNHFDTQIEGYRETFQETKCKFIKKIEKLNACDFSEIKDADFVTKSSESFKEVSYESGKMSRFVLDKNFHEDLFRKLYDQWVINSLNKKFAEKIYYLEKESIVIGFVTLQIACKSAKIGLISTLPSYQGKGLGKILLKTAENYCFQNKIDSLEISTQKENLQAIGFYKKMGYILKNEFIIKHFWNIWNLK